MTHFRRHGRLGKGGEVFFFGKEVKVGHGNSTLFIFLIIARHSKSEPFFAVQSDLISAHLNH